MIEIQLQYNWKCTNEQLQLRIIFNLIYALQRFYKFYKDFDGN